jgi:hypothetical protein
MDMTFLVFFTICVIALITWRIWKKLTWKTVMVGRNLQSEEALRQKYEYYRVNKIRCKIKTELQSTSNFSGSDPMMGGTFQPNSGLIKLLVHKSDIDKANKIN